MLLFLLSDYALTTLDAVRETLGIAEGDTTKDNLIIRKINQATEIIEGWCGRRFKESTYTDELYDATYDNQIVLRNWPVTGTIPFALSARDTTLNSGSFDSIDSEQYFIDRAGGVIDAVSGFWGGFDQWSVTYSAGYATIPADLAEAAATLAAYLVTNDPAMTSGVSSKREGSREIHYFDRRSSTNDALFNQLGIRATLDRYGTPAIGSLR